MKKLILMTLLSLSSVSAFAAPQTVTLTVPSMNCPACPFTVRKALQKVEGVSEAEVVFKDRLAIVTFDDEKTSVEALTEATTNAGYPSSLTTVKE